MSTVWSVLYTLVSFQEKEIKVEVDCSSAVDYSVIRDYLCKLTKSGFLFIDLRNFEKVLYEDFLLICTFIISNDI